MNPRPVPTHEASAKRPSFCSEPHGLGHTRTIANPARSEDREWMQRFDGNRQQLPYARGTPDVAARLDALDDHRIDPSPRSDDGLVKRTDLHQNNRARAVHQISV